MKKFFFSFVMGITLFLFPLSQIAYADCTFSSSGSSSGQCWNINYSYSCDGRNGDPVESCGGSYGGCDWGDGTSAYYSTSSCS